MENKQSKSKVCYKFSKIPMTEIKEPVPKDIPKDLHKMFDIRNIKKKQIFTSMYELSSHSRKKESLDYSCYLKVDKVTVEDFKKISIPYEIEMSRYQEKLIRKRIQAKTLEEKYPHFINDFIKDVRQEYSRIIHNAGMNHKIKSCHPEEKFVIMPYKFVGRTEKYHQFLTTRSLFQNIWILHYPVVKKVHSEFVRNLPPEMFRLQFNGVYNIDDITDIFNKKVAGAKSTVEVFYKKVISIVEKEEKLRKFRSFHYLKVVTILLTLHISECITQTIKHIVEFTAAKEPHQYIFLKVYFSENLLMQPTSEELEKLYNSLIDNILNISNDLFDLESRKSKSMKNISLFITDEFISESKQTIKQNIALHYKPILEYLLTVDNKVSSIYRDLYSNNFLESIVDMNFEEGCKKISFYRKFLNIVLFIPDFEFFRIARVSFTCYKETICTTLKNNINMVFEKLAYQHFWEVNDICECFGHIKMRATRTPETTEELVETGKYMNYIKTEYLDILENRVIDSLTSLCKIIDLGIISEEHMELNCLSIIWLQDILPIIEQYTATFDSLKYEAEERLQKAVEEVGEMIKNVFPLLTLLNEMDNIAITKKYLHYITLHMKKIKEIETQIDWINQEEVTLSFPKSTYSEYEELKNYIYPFHHLLHVCMKVELNLSTWQDGPFENLDYDLVKDMVEKFHKELNDTYKIYRQKLRQAQDENLPMQFKGTVDDPDILNWPAPLKLCGMALKHIEEFKPAVQVIKIICNKCLMKRHWQAMSEIAGVDITPNAGSTLRKLMQVDFFARLEEYEIISVGATKEKLLLGQLNTLQNQWEQINFQISTYKEFDLRILVSLEEIETVITDQTTIVFNMETSVFVKPFEQEVKVFHETIIKISKTLNYWYRVQTFLIKLYPLVAIKELNKIIPTESDKLEKVINEYNRCIHLILEDKNVIKIVSETDLTVSLENCVRDLELVYIGICYYLEIARCNFPRFYFISNDEFIKALSNPKAVLNLESFVNKFFQGVKQLQINNNKIDGVLSVFGEQLNFLEPIPNEESLESMFRNLELAIKSKLKTEIMECYQIYSKTEFKELFSKYSSQVLNVVTSCFWTENIEMALGLQSEEHLLIHINKLDDSILNKVQYLKKLLNNSERIRLKTVLINEMYIRSIIRKISETKIISIDCFEWEAHFKYYLKDNNIQILMMNCKTDYMYEYLKNCNYIITPVTERCLRMLSSTYHMNYFGLLNGNSDSGKYETIKYLANIFGNFVLKFVCGEGLNAKIIERIIKGTLLCGSWVYFENFISLKPSVMSAISEYIFNVQMAKKENYRYCLIGGSKIYLKPSCFISVSTKNNSYMRISDDFIKLFRICTLLKPDTEVLAEITLQIQGFKSALYLGKKISTLIKCLVDNFSKNNYYHLGLTKFFQILSEIESIAMKNMELNEEDIVFSAIYTILSQTLPVECLDDFSCILSYIFPDFATAQNQNLLEESSKSICDDEALQWNLKYSNKICEVYDAIKNKNSLIIVGNTCSSKTTIVNICMKLFKILDKQEFALHYISPNCFEYKCLYGYFTDSCEWVDGIVPKFCRIDEKINDYNLMVFDGDLNPHWIDNIITLIKDRELYLESGEILKLLTKQKVLFEVDNLRNCSPSVVSHSTVIYVNQEIISWKAAISTFITTCKADWMQGHENQIHDIFLWVISACLEYIKSHCKLIYSINDINLVNNIMTLTKLILDEAFTKNRRDDDMKNLTTWIQATIIQAGMLGIGTLLDDSSKSKFDEFYKILWRGQNAAYPYPQSFGKLDVGIPQDGLVIDFQYIFKQRGNWKLFQDLLKSEKIVDVLNMQDTLIPTVDSMRNMYILKLLIRNHSPVILAGPSCSGKSILIEFLLKTTLQENLWDISHINFNLYLTAEKTQHTILSNLNKKEGGIYIPSNGKRFMLFIDNLNQTTLDDYDNSSCTELLRQFLSYKVWYDFNSFNEVFVENLQILSVLNTSEYGKSIDLRFLKHFHIFGCSTFSDDIVTRIFTNILGHIWRQNGFPSDTTAVINQIVEATSTVLKNVLIKFKPTPNHPHYTFSINNLSSVINGCCLLKKETYDANKKICIKLWLHENMRVFGDRLKREDNEILEVVIKEALSNHFGDAANELIDTSISDIIFSAVNGKDLDESKYDEIEIGQMIDEFKKGLVNYNSEFKNEMRLIFFDYAIEKLFKINRLLGLKSGNAIFLGCRGLGRVCLTKLISFIRGYAIFQPSITDQYTLDSWTKELKNVLKEAGAIERKSVYIISEKELLNEQYLQYIELLLQNGDIYDIFTPEEKQEILELSRLSAQGGNRNLDISSASVFQHFTTFYKKNLRLMLCLSSNPKSIRNRFRNFLTFKNLHIIYWEDWPNEVLQNVAEVLLTDAKLESEDVSESIKCFTYFHRSFQNISNNPSNNLPFTLKISPIYFINLVKIFKEMFKNEKAYIEEKTNSFSQGLAKLSYAANQILNMEKVLADYKPQLAEMTANAIKMTEQIALETIEVEKASELVRQDEQVACKQAIVAQNLKSECESELAQAIPILEDAISALNTLKPSDITLVKSMKNPPDAIKLVMAAVCVIKDIKPDRIPDPSTGRKTIDYWGPSKRILGDMNFLQTLKDFDKDNIKPEIMVKIRKDFLPHKDFKPHIVAKASSAAEGLCKWIIAMDMYDKVAKEVAPKKEKLGKAEKEYADTMEILNQKKEEVKRIEEKLAALNALLADSNKKQLKLQKEVDLCNKKLISAQKLIGSLDEEQIRWTEAVKKLEKQNQLLLGNVILTTGIVTYLSSLYYTKRLNILDEWHKYINKILSCSSQFQMTECFSSKLKIEVQKPTELLKDNFFQENILIYEFSHQHAIFIDPEYQATKWFRKNELGNNLTVTTFCDVNFFSLLKNCLVFGKPILIHKIIKTIPTYLYNFISKYYYNDDAGTYVTINNEIIKIDPNFRMYLVCNVAEPNFTQEIFMKLTIINFSVSYTYLSKHLLRIVSEFENPVLKKEKKEIYGRMNKYQSEISFTEKFILKTLCESQADILEDEESIRILEEYKLILKRLRLNFEESVQSEQSLFQFTDQYQAVSNLASNIYSLTSRLNKINHIYQFSFQWFLHLYYDSILYAEKSKHISTRCEKIIINFIRDVYNKINCSLLQKDKVSFAFLLAIFILKHKSLITDDEINVFTGVDSQSRTILKKLSILEKLPAFSNFCSRYKDMSNLNQLIEKLDTLKDPTKEWNFNLSNFQKLILTKIFKPQLLYFHIKSFIITEIGSEYLESPIINLNEIYNSSTSLSPILLLGGNGIDFIDNLYILVKKKQLLHTFKSIYLNETAHDLIKCSLYEAQQKGNWLLIQNCHLDENWLKNLEEELEKMNYENTNPNFRLWLTSKPTKKLPVTLLQNSIKVTFDCAGNFKQTLYQNFSQDFVSNYFSYDCTGKKEVFTKLLYGIIVFQSILTERSRYDNISWKTPYKLDKNIIKSSIQLLHESVINKNITCTDIEKICFLIGNYQYGSQVGNSVDLIYISKLLNDFINIDISKSRSYYYNNIKEYFLPIKCDYLDYKKVILKYPEPDIVELLSINKYLSGKHYNILSNNIMNTLFNVFNVETYSTLENHQTLLIKRVDEILESLPEKLNQEEHKNEFILAKEFQRYNNLLEIIKQSISVLKSSLEGNVLIPLEIESIAMDLLHERVPKKWENFTYPSQQSLPQFLKTLNQQINYLRNFKPNQKSVWLPAFSLPKALIWKITLELSKANGIGIESINLGSDILSDETKYVEENSYLITGLFIVNAQWDQANHCLTEVTHHSHNSFPPIIFKSINSSLNESQQFALYQTSDLNSFVCSMYFIQFLNYGHWLKRGVRFLCHVPDVSD